MVEDVEKYPPLARRGNHQCTQASEIGAEKSGRVQQERGENVATNRTNIRLKLKDGRTLGYAEYRAPEGMPVFYFHGHPSSRLDWPSLVDNTDAASELNVRIIAVDRPGYGLSEFNSGRQILDWPDDVLELADALQLDRYAALGYSGGGPYAAACAFKIPERLTATAIVSGMGPADAPGTKDGFAWIYAGKGRVTRRLLLMMTSVVLRKKPDRFISKMREGLKGPDKELVLENPEMLERTVDCFNEALRSGIAGTQQEAGL
jgi:pimeloyl-ACP methyl ester carboxylesterase